MKLRRWLAASAVVLATAAVAGTPATASQPVDPASRACARWACATACTSAPRSTWPRSTTPADPQYRQLVVQRVLLGHRRERDEVGVPGAHPGHLQLGARPTS